jgi:N-alpha-acetyltransferase 30
MDLTVACQVALETEVVNTGAMKLYERLGFLRSKRLHRYYLNGNSAYRLVLYLKEGVGSIGANYDFPPPAATATATGNDSGQLPLQGNASAQTLLS